MNEWKRIVADMESVFAESSYPGDFLAAYDQMECLASHTGRETFLVQRKSDGEMAVASCYDRTVFPFCPDFQLLRELNHPGIPRYYEQFQNKKMLCIVREYIEGEPLNTYAQDRQLSVGEIAALASQLCSILVFHQSYVDTAGVAELVNLQTAWSSSICACPVSPPLQTRQAFATQSCSATACPM